MKENRKNHPEKCKQEIEKNYNKIKNDPIKYQNLLDKNKEYKHEKYHNDPV